MADIHCYDDSGSSTLFHSSPEEMIHIQRTLIKGSGSFYFLFRDHFSECFIAFGTLVLTYGKL